MCITEKRELRQTRNVITTKRKGKDKRKKKVFPVQILINFTTKVTELFTLLMQNNIHAVNSVFLALCKKGINNLTVQTTNTVHKAYLFCLIYKADNLFICLPINSQTGVRKFAHLFPF